MKKYWRELGSSYAAMPTAVRFTFTLMVFLPGLLLLPLLWFLANFSKTTAAQFSLLNVARTDIKLDPAALNVLTMEMFSATPALAILIYSIVALIVAGNFLWLLMHFAGLRAQRTDKVTTREIADSATA